jgi:hypothetical protein
MKLPPYPDCPIPPAYFVAVNVTAFWVAMPIASLLSRRHPLVDSIIMVNIFFHVMSLVGGVGYGAGTLSAIVIFIPLSIWLIRTGFGPPVPPGRMRYGALGLIITGGIILHAILTAPMILFLKGMIGSTPMVVAQVVNPFVLMLILWLGEKWRGGVLIAPLERNVEPSVAVR